MSNKGETKDLVSLQAGIEMANDLIYRDSDNKSADYEEAVRFLDELKDNHAGVLEQNRDAYGELLETLGVALVRNFNFLQADAIVDMYHDAFPDQDLPDRLQEVAKITSEMFSTVEGAMLG